MYMYRSIYNVKKLPVRVHVYKKSERVLIENRKSKFVVDAHFAASNVIECLIGFDDASALVASASVHEPVRELVLEVVTLATPVTLDVRCVAEVLQTTSWTCERLSTASRSNGMLQNDNEVRIYPTTQNELVL